MDAVEKQKLIDELKSKHGQVYEVTDETSEYGLVLVRKLTKLEYRKVKEQRDDDNRKAMVDEYVTQTCVVHPDQAAVQKLLDAYPVFGATVMGAVLEASGAERLKPKKV